MNRASRRVETPRGWIHAQAPAARATSASSYESTSMTTATGRPLRTRMTGCPPEMRVTRALSATGRTMVFPTPLLACDEDRYRILSCDQRSWESSQILRTGILSSRLLAALLRTRPAGSPGPRDWLPRTGSCSRSTPVLLVGPLARPARRRSRSANWRPRRGSPRPGCARSRPPRTWTRWMPPWASCGPRAGPHPKTPAETTTPSWTGAV